jgi:hypothetical protein
MRARLNTELDLIEMSNFDFHMDSTFHLKTHARTAVCKAEEILPFD